MARTNVVKAIETCEIPGLDAADCVFTRTQHKTIGGKTLDRYDGFDGRYSVFVSKFKGSKTSHLQLFTIRTSGSSPADLYAPLLCLDTDGLYPVGVRIELPKEAQAIHIGKPASKSVIQDIMRETSIGLLAADTICKQFIEPLFGKQIRLAKGIAEKDNVSEEETK